MIQTAIRKPRVLHTSHHRLQQYMLQLQQAYMLDRPKAFEGERRRAERFAATIPISLTPLDDEMKPMAYTQEAMSRDISWTGISVLSRSPQSNRLVEVTISPAFLIPLSVVGEVKYCVDQDWYYRLGIEFVVSDKCPSLITPSKLPVPAPGDHQQ